MVEAPCIGAQHAPEKKNQRCKIVVIYKGVQRAPEEECRETAALYKGVRCTPEEEVLHAHGPL